MSDCRKCADFDWCVKNEECGLFKSKPQTNADRIRAMTDDKLAEFLRSFTIIHMKSLCEYVGINYVDDDNDTEEKEEAIKSVLEWLKEET